MKNSLTSISLQQCVQSSLQQDVKKSKKKGRPKHTIDAVKHHVESFGYQLLSTTYVGANAKLDLVCPNQHMYRAAYASFQQGHRCSECPDGGGRQKLTIESVRQHIESFGHRLLSTKYVKALEKLEIICPNQHRYLASYNSFQRGIRCAECAGNKTHTIDAVRQHIESFGYRLRSNTYVGAHAKLDTLCPVGHSYSVSYNKFQKGIRCSECYHLSQRRTMPNGEDWKPALRNSTADIAWRKAVKKRDGQICQACFYPSKEIHAHHIESFARNPELQTELSNGVTLCETCHTALHSRYGMMTATRSDLAEFTRLKCR